MKLRNIIFTEGLKMSHSFINGKKIVSKYQGESDKLDDILKLVSNLPSTVESLKYPIEAGYFNPKDKEVKPPFNVNEIKDDLLKVIQEYKDRLEEDVYEFELRSYYGLMGKEETAPYYIVLRTKGSDQFGKDMASGKYGPLD